MQEFLKLPPKERRTSWIDQLAKKDQGMGKVVLDLSDPPHDKFAWDEERSAVRAAAVKALSAHQNSPLADKLRKALDTPVKMEFAEVDAKKALELVSAKLSGVNVVLRAQVLNLEEKVSFNFKEPVPVGAWCSFSKTNSTWCFILRDYGIVVVKAMDRRQPPADALRFP